MISPMVLVGIAAFVGVTALVGGLAVAFRERPSNRIEDRLGRLTAAGAVTPKEAKQASVLAQPLDATPGLLEGLLERIGNINISRLLEQADTSLSVARLAMICLLLGLGGAAACVPLQLNPIWLPLVGLCMASLPFFWLFWRRKRRLRQFAGQLPDALEMMGRALRSGQSLATAFSMIANEVAAPLGKEFERVFEEQNLGIPLEQSLESMTERVPNLDLKFFSTAVILQRQTGGDLAEILDKISHLIRERFQIWGQVQALTGEGRLSGVVLMGLPVVLFLVVYKLNPDYVMVLFTEPMGKKMLGWAIVLQVLGALVIRKIVNIKV